jgi:hypothetical protein
MEGNFYRGESFVECNRLSKTNATFMQLTRGKKKAE